mgnify:CR=1 FL=1
MDNDVEKPAKEASSVLRTGGIIVYPTETVYGLGGNALDEDVVSKIFEIKGRGAGKPMIVLVKDFKMAGQVADLGNYKPLLKKYWPGALTGIFRTVAKFPSGIISREGTVAIRISPHPFVKKLFEFVDFPLISTSANKSGDKNSSTIKEVKKSLGTSSRLVDYFVDWSSLDEAVPSTVVSFISNTPKVLRQGSIIFL